MPQRIHPRISIGSSAVQVVVDGGETAPLKNISVGGVFLRSPRRPPVGDAVKLSIRCGERVIDVDGRVTHLQIDGYGVAFVKPLLATVRAIEDLIRGLLEVGGDPANRRGSESVLASAAMVWRDGQSTYSGEFRELSDKGAFVVSAERPAIGSEIEIYLAGFGYDYESPMPSELRGSTVRVVHHQADGFGVEFVHPSAEFVMGLRRLSVSSAGH